jgi:hypothetical protein
MQEQWRPVPNFPNYEVSDYGRVRSLPRIESVGSTKPRNRSGRLLVPSPITATNKYPGVNLCRNDGSPRFTRVHRLVAEVFLPNPNSLPVVNHLDSDTSNNRADNLEWTTQHGNMRHAATNDRLGGITNEMIAAAHKMLQAAERPNVAGVAHALGVKYTPLARALKGFRAEHLDLDAVRVPISREERYQRAVELRAQGRMLHEIGADLGITESAACRLLRRPRPTPAPQ